MSERASLLIEPQRYPQLTFKGFLQQLSKLPIHPRHLFSCSLLLSKPLPLGPFPLARFIL
jgi:hypothetical protein